ncbi:hypothetical protein EDM55_05595 [Brevibacillus centrosporus]|nr:hypothetical protein EDM55_05595 [Brevibacillus centrosporus]
MRGFWFDKGARKAFADSRKQSAGQRKREKSEGIRDTAQAEWKKRNLPLASTSEQASERRPLWTRGPLLEWSRTGMTP